MSNDFEVSVDVAVPADDAWALAGNPADLGWFAAVKSCRVEGDRRYAEMVGGANLVELLLDRDDPARTYSYSVIGGSRARMRFHKATISVEETPGGSRVRWHTVADVVDREVDLEARLGGVMRKGLEELKRVLETGGA